MNLKEIKDLLESVKFQIEQGSIFSLEDDLNRIINGINNNGWFFTREDKKNIADLKKQIQIYHKDQKEILKLNQQKESIKVTTTTNILKKKFKHNNNKFNDYLSSYLTPKYQTRLLRQDKALKKINSVLKKLLKPDKIYKNLIKNKLIKNNKIDSKVKKRIEALLPLLDIDEKDLEEALRSFRTSKNKKQLISNLTKSKAYHYYIPIYNIRNLKGSLKLNKDIELLGIKEFRKRFNKYNGYDSFINWMNDRIFQETAFVHIKVSSIGQSTASKIAEIYYEQFIDIIAFFQSELTFKFNDIGGSVASKD